MHETLSETNRGERCETDYILTLNPEEQKNNFNVGNVSVKSKAKPIICQHTSIFNLDNSLQVISQDKLVQINKTLGFSKYNKNISGGVYKLDLVKETDGQTSQRNSPRSRSQFSKQKFAKITYVQAPKKFPQSPTQSKQEIQSNVNMRLMSISSGLRQHILPKTNENITGIQKKRVKNYFDLIGTHGEGSKIIKKLINSDTKEDIQLYREQQNQAKAKQKQAQQASQAQTPTNSMYIEFDRFPLQKLQDIDSQLQGVYRTRRIYEPEPLKSTLKQTQFLLDQGFIQKKNINILLKQQKDALPSNSQKFHQNDKKTLTQQHQICKIKVGMQDEVSQTHLIDNPYERCLTENQFLSSPIKHFEFKFAFSGHNRDDDGMDKNRKTQSPKGPKRHSTQIGTQSSKLLTQKNTEVGIQFTNESQTKLPVDTVENRVISVVSSKKNSNFSIKTSNRSFISPHPENIKQPTISSRRISISQNQSRSAIGTLQSSKEKLDSQEPLNDLDLSPDYLIQAKEILNSHRQSPQQSAKLLKDLEILENSQGTVQEAEVSRSPQFSEKQKVNQLVQTQFLNRRRSIILQSRTGNQTPLSTSPLSATELSGFNPHKTQQLLKVKIYPIGANIQSQTTVTDLKSQQQFHYHSHINSQFKNVKKSCYQTRTPTLIDQRSKTPIAGSLRSYKKNGELFIINQQDTKMTNFDRPAAICRNIFQPQTKLQHLLNQANSNNQDSVLMLKSQNDEINNFFQSSDQFPTNIVINPSHLTPSKIQINNNTNHIKVVPTTMVEPLFSDFNESFVRTTMHLDQFITDVMSTPQQSEYGVSTTEYSKIEKLKQKFDTDTSAGYDTIRLNQDGSNNMQSQFNKKQNSQSEEPCLDINVGQQRIYTKQIQEMLLSVKQRPLTQFQMDFNEQEFLAVPIKHQEIATQTKGKQLNYNRTVRKSCESPLKIIDQKYQLHSNKGQFNTSNFDLQQAEEILNRCSDRRITDNPVVVRRQQYATKATAPMGTMLERALIHINVNKQTPSNSPSIHARYDQKIRTQNICHVQKPIKDLQRLVAESLYRN